MSNPRFQFRIENHDLTVELDRLGREVVFLDGDVVHSSRSIRLSGRIPIEIDREEFEIHVNVDNLFSGRLSCSLYRSNRLIISKYTKAALGEKNKFLSIILLLLLCGTLGYIAPSLGGWIWISPILFVLAVFVAMSCRERIYEIHTKET